MSYWLPKDINENDSPDEVKPVRGKECKEEMSFHLNSGPEEL
jgi:hypothetical protein